MNSRKVRCSCVAVCLSVLLGFSWSGPAVAGDAADLRLAAGTPLSGPIPSPQTKPLVDRVEANPTQPPATSVTPKAAGSTLVPTKSRLIKVDGLTRQQFDQLKIQNSDVIEYKGKQYEVGMLRSQMQKAEATALATMNQNAPKAQAKFDAYRSNFDKVQLSNLAAANAQVAAKAKILMQQRVQASTGQTTAPSKPIPVIDDTSVETRPDGDVLIVGSGFGNPIGMNAPGKVKLSLVKPTNLGAMYSPPIWGFYTVIKWWSDTAIVCTIPADIKGFMDQQGSLIVEAGGTHSNSWPVKFIATREVIRMKGFRGGELVYCDDTSTPNNKCKVGEEKEAWTFLGSHSSEDFFQFSCKGGDVWKASLANGWTFEDVTITEPWDSRGGRTLVVSGFKKSSSSLTLVVEWSFFLYWEGLNLYRGLAFYPMELRIVGPKGIPYY